jgi:thiosulfate dehydrogenase
LLIFSAAVIMAICAAVVVSCDRLLSRQSDLQPRAYLSVKLLGKYILALSLSGIALSCLMIGRMNGFTVRQMQAAVAYDKSRVMTGPAPDQIGQAPDAKLIAYGRDLIVHTGEYFGPAGKVRPNSINGLNCQSCHLEAGTKSFGNNYFAVAATYPQFWARSGSLETISKRINDCFERSLNGQAIDTSSLEMQAIKAYMAWLGAPVPKGEKPKGSGLIDLPFLSRPADPEKGEVVFQTRCASCHGADGQGGVGAAPDVRYPPLWGDRSFNEAAGLYRLSRFAGFVKANMPFGANYENPQLSDEEAWDVAAFVNSRPRPRHPFLAVDFSVVSKKPFDHPFGPYADPFTEEQHKFGPFKPIADFYKKPPPK